MSEPLPDNLPVLLAEFSRSEARELHIRRGEVEIYLSKEVGSGLVASRRSAASVSPRAEAPLPEPTTPPAAVTKVPAGSIDVPEGATIIKAPNLGTFYRAPKPGADNYVEVGSTVSSSDEVCLIEVMKLFTAVRAGVEGRIQAVLAADGAMVEAGQPLFAVVKN